MIYKDKGEFVCECNDCGEKEYGGTVEGFRDFVDQLKAAGWKIRKDGAEWQHACPSCQE